MIPRSLTFAFSAVFLISVVHSKNLPNYISKCSIKDPEEFSKCALENAKKAFPFLIQGDDKYKVPKLDPLRIPLLELNAGPTLNLTVKDLIVHGIPNVEIRSIRYDKPTRKFSVNLYFDHLMLEGDYNIAGKILILPIVGTGRGHMEFKKEDVWLHYDLNTVKNKNGKEVFKVENPKVDMEAGGASFQLDNLFNGDKTLGEEMNRFLNENWKEVLIEFQDLIKGPLSSVAFGAASGIINNLTAEGLFNDA